MFPMMTKLFKAEEQISIGKYIKLCFHVQRFSMNCFCVSFNSLSWNVQWRPEVLMDGIESNHDTFTGSQHLTSIVLVNK